MTYLRPRKGSHRSHASKSAGNVDKLEGIWIGDWLVRPPFWNRPTPGEQDLPIWEADPMIIDVERCSFPNNVAGSAADPHNGKVFCRRVICGR